VGNGTESNTLVSEKFQVIFFWKRFYQACNPGLKMTRLSSLVALAYEEPLKMVDRRIPGRL